jgi:hypothetical protein
MVAQRSTGLILGEEFFQRFLGFGPASVKRVPPYGLEKITAALPRTRVLATGSRLDQNDVIESIGLGAKGYIRETASAAVGSGNSEPLIPEILSRSAVEDEASSKFR